MGEDQAAARAVLDALRDVDGPALSADDAVGVVDQAWDALAAAIADGPDSTSLELLTALRRLRHVDRALVAQRDATHSEVTRRLGDTLAQLEQSTASVESVVQLAPRLICQLGFERAFISQVCDGMWLPEAVFIVNDPDWAADIARVGRENPQPLVPGLFETEIVRRREALVVTGVQQAAARVHQPIANVSKSRSYVAAPVLSRGKVVGFVHADRFSQGRDVDEHDREVLVAFANGLRLALGRAALTERLQSTQDQLSSLVSSLAQTTALSGDVPLSLGERPATAAAASPVEASWFGTEPPAGLPKDLTRREVEVLSLMAAGRTNAAIARELVIAEATVKQHVKHVLRKVGAANRSEATALWFRASAGRPA